MHQKVLDAFRIAALLRSRYRKHVRTVGLVDVADEVQDFLLSNFCSGIAAMLLQWGRISLTDTSQNNKTMSRVFGICK